jgi:hypothetical protein
MSLIQETQGLETILGMACLVLSVIGMMAVGMMMDVMKLLRNPYMRNRMSKIMLNKVSYAMA